MNKQYSTEDYWNTIGLVKVLPQRTVASLMNTTQATISSWVNFKRFPLSVSGKKNNPNCILNLKNPRYGPNRTLRKKYNFESMLNEDFAYLLGAFMGDGYAKHGLCFHLVDMEFLIKLKKIMQTLFKENLTIRLSNHKNKKKTWNQAYKLKIFSKNIADYLMESTKNKTIVPIWINNRRLILNFLSGFIDAEGHTYKDGAIKIAQKDKFITDEIICLLNKLKIEQSVSSYISNQTSNRYYEIRIRPTQIFNEFLSINRKMVVL